MRIVQIEKNPNGSHNNHCADHITSPPEGWAVIPDDLVCENFPFGEVKAEELTRYRDVETQKEVTKTREVETVDEDGNPVTVTEEYAETETVVEQEPYTVLTVTEWAPGEMPEPEPLPEPAPAEKREEAYNTERLIEWDGNTLTVTEAAQLWQYYAAEGSEKATALTVLIAEAKAKIREEYPDEEVQV